jgi:hypothetical protein
MFTPKSFVGIVSGMISHMRSTQRAVTDFHIGSVARTLVEAPAIEMDALYQAMDRGITEAIPVALYEAFGFGTLPAACGGGTVRVTATAALQADFVIPAGTKFKRISPNIDYQTLIDYTITPVRGYVDVVLVATEADAIGNGPVGVIFTSESGLSQQVTAISTTNLSGGRGVETEADRKVRFLEFIGSLSKSTLPAVLYHAKQAVVKDSSGSVAETVFRAGVTESAGRVEIYLYGSHGAPSLALLAAAKLALEGDSVNAGVRPAGVQIDVLPMTAQIVNVHYKIKLFSGAAGGAAMIASVQSFVETHLAGILPGEILHVEALIDSALAVTGVQKVLCENNANIVCPQNAVLIPGAVTVEWLNA